jgi:GNAT superfamily N-acetyltransferase
MSAGVEIRLAVKADVRGIVQLWTELQEANSIVEPRLSPHRRGPEWYEEFMEMQLEDSACAVFVAVAGSDVAGYTFGQVMQRPTLRDGRCGFVADLCVREDCRRTGVGTRLYQELKGWFNRRDVTSLEVQVVTQNEAALAFWNKMGFGEFLKTLRVDG